jgi:hypothetical protein
MRRAPAHAFAPSELRTFTLAAMLAAAAGCVGEASAAAAGRRVLCMSVERVGRCRLRSRRTLVASAMCGADVLRTTMACSGTASPIVHLHNADGSHGGTLCAALRLLLPPAFGVPFQCVPYQILPLRDDYNDGVLPFCPYDQTYGVHPSTAALQEYGRSILRCTAGALRAHDADGAAAAADDVAAATSQPFFQLSAIGYTSHATLRSHVDIVGGYLVLLSLGCTVDFLIDGRVIAFASGDALVFNGGASHAVMHGMRRAARHVPAWTACRAARCAPVGTNAPVGADAPNVKRYTCSGGALS